MKAKNIINLAISLLFVLSLVFVPSDALAVNADQVYSLSYNLPEGGENRIELTSDSPNKYRATVRVSVTKIDLSLQEQFEIVQRAEPLRKKDNPSVAIGDNFVVRRIIESTPAGARFDLQSNDTPVGAFEQRLYLSDTAGTQLNFTLVYGVVFSTKEDLPPGEYSGQITFILRPVGGGSLTNQIRQILYVDVVIPEGEAKVEVTPLSGLHTIILNSQDKEKQKFDVGVKISGRFDNAFSIIQNTIEPFLSEEGDKLDYGVLKYETQEVNKGMSVSLAPMSSHQQTIYTSLSNGDHPENFMLTYSLADVSKYKAGKYRTRISYFLEEKGAFRPLGKLDLEVGIEPVFELLIKTEDDHEDDQGGIAYSNLKPSDPPRENEVIIEVKSNVLKKYQISQNVPMELMDKRGNKIPFQYFTIRTESTETKGILKAPNECAITKDDTILFISDEAGSADKFKLIYKLYPRKITPGDYSTRITYSLVEI